ncbi:DUF4031 domain-containing protein [Aestuariimicrobium soli]|uniref:DUF4031 domain-containing protein n=1 Tax=Aestuariimicrobium soli TaxID=2035834 RepID=UPI003EBA0213
MAILIDTPRWPAHGTLFGHLVSDRSLTELHRFARSVEIPLRAFDHDHYDVAERHLERLVAAGALPVTSRELVSRLTAGGLRVRRPEKLPAAASLIDPLRALWADLVTNFHRRARPTGAERGLVEPACGSLYDAGLGDDLLAAWSAPTRHYHDPRHLWMMLAALDQLGEATPALRLATPTLRLATWFHDAVYDGVPGRDEEESARWAERALPGLVDDATVAEVARLVRLTTTHRPDPDDAAGQALSDADLSTLAGPEARYWMYARAIRLEYAHVDDAAFRTGRATVLQGFLDTPRLFHTETGHRLWEGQARANISRELDFLLHD